MPVTGYEVKAYADLSMIAQTLRKIEKSLAIIAKNSEIIADLNIPEVGEEWFAKAKMRAKEKSAAAQQPIGQEQTYNDADGSLMDRPTGSVQTAGPG